MCVFFCFRYNVEEIRAILLDEFDEEDTEQLVSNEDPLLQLEGEESDAELEGVIFDEEEDDSYDSNDSIEMDSENIHISKDNTEWSTIPPRSTQTVTRNLLRQKCGPPNRSKNWSPKENFKSFLTPEISSIIIRESNRKEQKLIDAFNSNLIVQYPDPNLRPPLRHFEAFTDEELDAYLGILIMAGLHRMNKENTDDMWKPDSLPLFRAAMSRDRFKFFMRCIRFDNDITRAERAATDKAAPIRDIWLMFNRNLLNGYKPNDCVTVDDQLFPYRGRTKFTQYIPSKPQSMASRYSGCATLLMLILYKVPYTPESQMKQILAKRM